MLRIILQRFVHKVKHLTLRCFAYNRFSAQIYYLLCSKTFAREQLAVINGRIRYLESGGPKDSSLLRRNIHRLEKGLLMRPRRGIFALDYIEETAEAYALRLRATKERNGTVDDGELAWAHDVLATYFQVVDDHTVVNRARQAFQGEDRKIQSNTLELERGANGRRIPYHRISNDAPLDYEALKALSMRRRSVRWFSEEVVPRESIDKAISIAIQAPSACNRQPFEFRIFDDREWVQKIAGLPMGTTGYAHNIPVIVVLIGRLRAYFSERDRHVVYIDASLAAMSFMLALETLGLSSCPINWPDIEHREQAMEEVLNLDPDERPIMLLAVGFPDEKGKVAYSQKKDLSRIRSYNNQ